MITRQNEKKINTMVDRVVPKRLNKDRRQNKLFYRRQDASADDRIQLELEHLARPIYSPCVAIC